MRRIYPPRFRSPRRRECSHLHPTRTLPPAVRGLARRRTSSPPSPPPAPASPPATAPARRDFPSPQPAPANVDAVKRLDRKSAIPIAFRPDPDGQNEGSSHTVGNGKGGKPAAAQRTVQPRMPERRDAAIANAVAVGSRQAVAVARYAAGNATAASPTSVRRHGPVGRVGQRHRKLRASNARPPDAAPDTTTGSAPAADAATAAAAHSRSHARANARGPTPTAADPAAPVNKKTAKVRRRSERFCAATAGRNVAPAPTAAANAAIPVAAVVVANTDFASTPAATDGSTATAAVGCRYRGGQACPARWPKAHAAQAGESAQPVQAGQPSARGHRKPRLAANAQAAKPAPSPNAPANAPSSGNSRHNNRRPRRPRRRPTNWRFAGRKSHRGTSRCGRGVGRMRLRRMRRPRPIPSRLRPRICRISALSRRIR